MARHKPGNQGFETSFEVRTHDTPLTPEAYARLPKHPIHIVLDRLRSAWNVGAIFRVADTVRAAEVVTCGYTAHPPHKKLEKTALGTLDLVPNRHFDTVIEAIDQLKREGVRVYGVETTSKSVLHTGIEYPRPVALVLGNEALGVQREALERCDELVEIPMHGSKNSLNVVSACAVVTFEILRQWSYGRGAARASCDPPKR